MNDRTQGICDVSCQVFQHRLCALKCFGVVIILYTDCTKKSPSRTILFVDRRSVVPNVENMAKI